MHERQDLGEARGKSETEKARQNLESEVLVRLNGLSEMSGLRPRSRDRRKSRTVTVLDRALKGKICDITPSSDLSSSEKNFLDS